MSEERGADEGGLVHQLGTPVTDAKGREVREVRLRTDVTVGDLEAMDGAKGEIGKSVLLIAELSGLAPSVIRKLKPDDFAALDKLLAAVLGKG